MGLIESSRKFIYRLFTRSGILLVILPWLQPLVVMLVKAGFGKSFNYTLTDDSGKTMKLCKVNSKVYPPFGVGQLESVRNFEVRPEDVLLCGYPKTGAHWMHEIMHMLVTGKAQLTKHGKEVAGFIEAMPRILLDSQPSPRVLNTHFLYEDLPLQIKERKTKIVITFRNVKDALVSFYNHHVSSKELYGYDGEFNDYFKLFMRGELDYGSYFDYVLSWDKVVKSESPNPILMVKFEDMKAKPLETVKEVAKFLEVDITEEFAKEVVEASNFKAMKAKRGDDPLRGKLFRKGVVGDWKNWFTEDQSAEVNKVWHQRMMGCLYQPDE